MYAEPPVMLPAWSTAAADAQAAVSDAAVDAAWRALNYLCATQLYLRDNVLLDQELHPSHVKAAPRGHWGVCPPVNWLLAHLGPLTAHRPAGSELTVLHGAGHAGASVLAHAYLNQTLSRLGDEPAWSRDAITALAAGFSLPERYGSEITPLIPGVRHTGGQLGPALAIAQGMVLDAPQRLTVPLIGDGECETGATAAAWLAQRALHGTGEHGAVLPVVLRNGLRMGGPSLLSQLSTGEVRAYFTGLGYRPMIHDGEDIASFRALLAAALGIVRPIGGRGRHPVIVLTMAKGCTGPVQVASRPIAGTPAVHKTPLRDPRVDPAEFEALRAWLSSYRPAELFTPNGQPSAQVQSALPGTAAVLGHAHVSRQQPTAARSSRFTDVSTVIAERASVGAFRVFSPDELASNRILSSSQEALPPWVTEILNEEICHAWLQGYTETGRDALLPTYDAFASINASLLVQHLKHRRLRHYRGDTGLPSVNYLLTSLGWNNTYTHQNPGLVSVLLDLEYAGTRIYTPADAHRAAVVLERMLVDRDRCNILVASKHPLPAHPLEPLADELQEGATIWPHLTHYGPADLVLASAGDVPAREMSQAADRLRTDHTHLRIRYVHINDLTVLGPPHTWPHALPAGRFTDLFGSSTPVLLATVGFPGSVRGLLAARAPAGRFHIVGYQDLGRPTSAQDLLDGTGLSARALSARALMLAKEQRW
jgi:xylulose-5-phosphate/fructose-6-phosphate phosphoketolase